MGGYSQDDWKTDAASDVKERHGEMGLVYKNIAFSTWYGEYTASFLDEASTIYHFRLDSKYFPVSVAYDSAKQSNVNEGTAPGSAAANEI